MLKSLLALFLSTLIAAPAYACPAFLYGDELRMDLPTKRENLRLYSLLVEGEKRRWVMQPLQVDPMSEEKVLLIEDGAAAKLSDPMTKFDRIALRMEEFGERAKTDDGLPCGGTQATELQDPSDYSKFSYLVNCQKTAAPALSAANPIIHNEAKMEIQSPRFHYEYQPNNQLMYKKLTTIDPATGKKYNASANADLMLHLDIRKFFTIDFTNEDVNSYVEGMHNGMVGLVTKIDFYLSLLFFKINLKMGTSASFYADAAHIPMIIDAPVHSKKRLHPGSGIAYTWSLEESMVPSPGKNMVVADAAIVKKIQDGWDALAPEGVNRCTGDPCIFSVEGKAGPQDFQMELQVPRMLVENGFYPIWVPNVGDFVKAMEWDDEPNEKLNNLVAIYFENSGVPKGKHRIEQWIRVVPKTDKGGTYSCPRPIRQRRVVNINDQTIQPVSH